MRVFSITFSLWFDPGWWAARRVAWKKRKYWVGFRKETPKDGSVGLVFEILSVDLKIILRGSNGQSSG